MAGWLWPKISPEAVSRILVQATPTCGLWHPHSTVGKKLCLLPGLREASVICYELLKYLHDRAADFPTKGKWFEGKNMAQQQWLLEVGEGGRMEGGIKVIKMQYLYLPVA